ncbi:MAG TPA: Crp/Fnr family transcriptional regulator [Terriglobales bacterium]|nr:Crp/Fnr family transcriptional regulator [Terriglobales bacterium]
MPLGTENTALDGVEQPLSAPVWSGRTDANGNAVRNHILASIPDSEFDALRPHLERVELPYHQDLLSADSMENAFFPNRGMLSLIIRTRDGRSVDVGIIGREGAVGTTVIVGLRKASYRTVVQISGDGFRIKSDDLVNISRSAPNLECMINRYAHVQGMQVAQLAACNRLHEIEQRLARWMLMCHDRIESDLLPMTHEFFAQMLGAGRPSVTLAAGALQRAGVIKYTRGKVNILDRKGLEQSACECYEVIRGFNGAAGLPNNPELMESSH